MKIYFILILFLTSSFLAFGKTVVVDKHGGLYDLIKNEYQSLDRLIVNGRIGDTDLKLLKRMGTDGNLQYLNLSNAIIVDKYDNETNSISGDTFRECLKFKEFLFPNRMTVLENYILVGCANLERITLPENLIAIIGIPFPGCEKLSSIALSSSNSFFIVIDDVIYSKDMKDFILYPANKKDKEYTILNGVETIRDASIENCPYIEKIILPTSLKHINGWTFRNLPNVKELTLPYNLESIGVYTFSDTGIKNIYMQSAIPPIIQRETFYMFSKSRCVLHVPKGSYPHYWLDDFWGEFVNISEYDFELPVSNINMLKQNDFTFTVSCGMFSFYSKTINNIDLYDLKGNLINKWTRFNGSNNLKLNNGIYILSVNGISRKIIIHNSF